jgi:hypothetical protein
MQSQLAMYQAQQQAAKQRAEGRDAATVQAHAASSGVKPCLAGAKHAGGGVKQSSKARCSSLEELKEPLLQEKELNSRWSLILRFCPQ